VIGTHPGVPPTERFAEHSYSHQPWVCCICTEPIGKITTSRQAARWHWHCLRAVVLCRNKNMKTLIHSFRFTVAALAGSAWLASASDSSSLQVPFTNLGVDTNATATLSAQFGASSSALSVKAANLTPGQSYTFNVWEVGRFTANADVKGRWQVTFRTPAKKGTPLLDFDPRAQTVSLSQGTNFAGGLGLAARRKSGQ
jgi:hypothetical protein